MLQSTVMQTKHYRRTLYRANGPSAETVLTAQSRAPLYGTSPVAGSTFMFIILVLMTSNGFDAKEATTAAMNADVTCDGSPSGMMWLAWIASLAWS